MVDFKKPKSFMAQRREQMNSAANLDESFLENIPTHEEMGESPNTTSEVASVPATKNAVGRPRKTPRIIRNNPKTTKFDDDTNRRLQLLKVDYKLDQQDIIFLAVQEYLNSYFPKGKASTEDLKRIRLQVAELNGNK